jgi:hypothetical protein
MTKLATLTSVACILLCVSNGASAASCSDHFKAQGESSSGIEYFAAAVVADVSPASALNQLRVIAASDGFKVHNEKSNLDEGRLVIEQVKGSRPFLIALTAVQKGAASELFIQTRLNAGATAKAEDMRQAMCGMLARVKGTADSQHASQNISAGRSTIVGTAFAKVALLTPRQYPPKGSAVGLIALTDEVKRWMSTAGRGGAAGYPDQIRKLVSYTQIHDDRGGFRFSSLPPGEYVLHISFDFVGNVHYQKYEGTDVVVDRRSGAVVASHDRVSQQSVGELRGAVVQKNITVQNDGDVVEVELSKTDVFAKGSILNPR